MSPSLRTYWEIVRPRWRWVAWGAIAAMALTAVFLLIWPPMYRSEATAFVRTPGDVSQVQDGGDLYAQSRAETYAALAKSTGVTSRVVGDLGLKLAPETLARRIQAKHIGRTALVQVRVNAPSPDEARRTTEVLLNELSADVSRLEAIPGSVAPRAELVVVDPPSNPKRVIAFGAPLYRVVIAVLALGGLFGALGAVIRARTARPAAVADPELDESDSESNSQGRHRSPDRNEVEGS